ncbi:MAG TPA: alkaline phosphatase family protein [Blastocatellia bacterium]|nr:alkaline phosphatase family protein [Blastocatellia bacterium]
MKILVIGLDAATLELIEPWAEAGRLPTLSRLMKEGATGRLISTPNMHSASAWTAILTGLNPGRHGLFVFSDRNFATGRQEFFKGGDRTGRIIGDYLAQHNLTSGFLNVPMTYPAQAAAGSWMISGLDAPALNESAFAPAALREEIFSHFPDYAFTPVGLSDLMKAGRVDDAITAWLRLTETQTAVAEYLIEAHPTDFFMTVFTASDWGGHNLWKHTQPLSDELRRVYEALDAAAARLLEHADEQTQVYVISDHGMGRHSGASYHLAEWLEAQGFMARHQSAPPRASLMSAGRRVAKNLLPVAIKETIKSRLGAERVKQMQAAEKDVFYDSIDWSRSRAYTEPGRHVININLAGRNPQGIVASADYERVCAEIINALGEWRDAHGTAVVERVVRRAELYAGPFVERASDLYVYWNPQAVFDEPPQEVRARGYWWSGDHRPEGILIASGPGIAKGARVVEPLVYDLLPTMMYAAGLPTPGGLDGRVIEQAFDEAYLTVNPLRVEQTASDDANENRALSQAEEELIEEKLRALGYL